MFNNGIDLELNLQGADNVSQEGIHLFITMLLSITNEKLRF